MLVSMLPPLLLRDKRRRRRRVEHLEIVHVMIGYGTEREVHVLELARVFLDSHVDAPQPKIERHPPGELCRGFHDVAWIKLPPRHNRQPGPAITPELQAQEAALERVNLLDVDRAHEPGDQQDGIA